MSNSDDVTKNDHPDTVETSDGLEDDNSVAAYNHGHMSMQGQNHRQMSQMDHMNMHTQYFSMKTNTDFLLEGITISSVQGIVLAMLLSIALSILIELLKTMAHQRGGRQANQLPKQMLTAHHLRTSVVHTLSAGVGYILMFCVMTMNVWLLVSVVLGSGIGHLIVRPLLLMNHSRDGDGAVIARRVRELEPLNDEKAESELEHERGKNELTVNM